MASAHRPWEDAPPNNPNNVHHSNNSVTSVPAMSTSCHKLPSISTLTENMPGAVPPSDRSPIYPPSISTPERDSGNWSMSHSARSSGYSSATNGTGNTGGVYQSSLLTAATSAQPSPNRLSAMSDPHNILNADTSQNSNNHQHGPPQTPTSSAPQPSALSQQPPLQQQHQHQARPSYVSGSSSTHPPLVESRRSSLDSHVNQGFGSLALNSTSSPYHSTNASQSSVVSSLQRERGISGGEFVAQTNGPRGGPPPGRPSSSSHGERRHFTPGRTAPAISSNPRSEIYNADRPTAGQAYAFPDPYNLDKTDDLKPPVTRRDSGADSFDSVSRYTTDSSRLPPGQHELPQGVHHHSLQSGQVRTLMGEVETTPNGSTPYGRPPEMRLTHKLAERKRRSDMKDCFDSLRQRLPENQNAKTSKWDTLSRAIDYISRLENSVRSRDDKIAELEAALEAARMGHPQQPQPMAHNSYEGMQGNPPQQGFPQQPFPAPFTPTSSQTSSSSPPQHQPHDPSRSLPSLNNGFLAPMQGVQYSDAQR